MSDRKRENAVNTELSLKKILYSRKPGYMFSNDIFEERIKSLLNKNSIWIDAGCGNNGLVTELEEIAPLGTGIDEVTHPVLLSPGKFINTSLDKIPFKDNSMDLITANMVVEHLAEPGKVLNEFYRVLKPGGRFIFRTTNKYYPTLLAGSLLPKPVKDKIIYSIFGVRSHDIFVTTYPLNTLSKIRKTFNNGRFTIENLTAAEDIHMFNRLAFEISFFMYRFQSLKPFTFLRNCIVCEVKKI